MQVINEPSNEIPSFEYSLKYFIGLFFIMAWFALFPSVVFGYVLFIVRPFSFDPLYVQLCVFCWFNKNERVSTYLGAF